MNTKRKETRSSGHGKEAKENTVHTPWSGSLNGIVDVSNVLKS